MLDQIFSNYDTVYTQLPRGFRLINMDPTTAGNKKQKQTLLSLSVFMKNPMKKTLKAHQKMEKINGLTTSPIRVKKPKVDKKAQQRLKEEKEITEGAVAWRRYMEAKGFDDVERHDPRLLYQVYGPAPDPDTISSSDDEGNASPDPHNSSGEQDSLA